MVNSTAMNIGRVAIATMHTLRPVAFCTLFLGRRVIREHFHDLDQSDTFVVVLPVALRCHQHILTKCHSAVLKTAQYSLWGNGQMLLLYIP